MINKIFKPRPVAASIRKTLSYLLGRRYLVDSTVVREGARVLMGDPSGLSELCESLQFSQTYTVGVLSFVEGNIQENLKFQLMSDFESVLMGDLDQSRYSVVWIEHLDKGRLELNYCFAHTDLATGKELTPYFDRADRQRVNAWLDVQNILHGYADPKDPSRKQAVKIPRDLPKGRRETIELIAACVEDGIKVGSVESRRDVIKLIKKLGYLVTSEKPASISIRPKSSSPDTKPLRLQGGYFQQEFDNSSGAAERAEANQRAFESSARERFATAQQTLDRLMRIKRERYSARYGEISQAEPRCAQPSSENSDKFSITSCGTKSPDRDGNSNDPKPADRPNSESASRTEARTNIQQHTDSATSTGASSDHHFTTLENPYDIVVDPIRAAAFASSSGAATHARTMRERIREAERRNSDAARARDAQRARVEGSPGADSHSSQVVAGIRTAFARIGQFAEWATSKISQLIVSSNEKNAAKVRIEEAEVLERVNARIKPVLARLRNVVERRLQGDEAFGSNSAAWDIMFSEEARSDPDLTHLQEQAMLFVKLEQERHTATNYNFITRTLADVEKREIELIKEFYVLHADPQKLESLSKSLKRMEDLADLHNQPILTHSLPVRQTNEPIKSRDSDNDFNFN